MRSHQKQNRRPRGTKPQDDDQYTNPRTEEGSDTYSRTHSHRTSHRSDGRRTSSASNRDYYEAYRDLSSHSRSRHDEEPWYGDSSRRYRDEDIYRREDEYDGGPRRETEWGRPRSTSDSQYASVRDDWPQRYEHPPSSYLDSSSWGATTSRDTYDNRSTYYEDWTTSGAREPSFPAQDEDKHIRHTGEHDRKDLGWNRDHRRGKGTQQRYQSDSGWESRRKDNGWDDRDRVPEEPPPAEDRTWEPASSWKSSHRGDGPAMQSRPQGNQRNFQSKHQYPKGGKRNHSSKHQRRDWRNDDSHLNNWTRRDLNTSSANRKAQKAQPKQKHHRSRSRSRSPAESYRSQLSSRGRSRSRSWSPAPKRRRRDHSPIVQRSPTPSDKDATNNWIPRHQRPADSRSPSPALDPEHSHMRRKSISSVSTITSDRSRSTSPHNKSRPVHRLPLTTGLRLDNIPQNNQHDDSRSYSPRSNGKYRSRENINESEWHPREAFSETRYDDSMPPPPIAPPSRLNYTSESMTNEPNSIPKVNISSKANRGSLKSTGFKSISRPQPAPSSSLRKFFPTDDDDADQLQPESPSTSRKQGWRPLRQASSGAKAVWPSREDEREPHEHTPPSWVRETPSHVQSGSTVNNQHSGIESPQQRASHKSTPRIGDAAQQRIVPPDLEDDDKRAEPPNEEADGLPMEVTSPTPVPHEMLPLPPPPPPPPSAPPPPPTEDVQDVPMHSAAPTPPKDLYSIITQVGEGTFGKVYKARNNTSNTLVALKRIRMETEKDGFPVTAMREIKLLQSLRHDNIVRLHEMMISNGSVYMVFEYMDHDLTGILSQTQFVFTPAHLKSLCHQMLAGLAYLHHKGVIHRDIKGSNILINNRGELKLADFGLARFYQKRRRTDYTNRVITLWYRPPELLFGATVYGPEVDMWSAGCIMLELFTKKPVFQGDEEIHQLEVIYKILGTPSLERWPALADLPWYQLVKPRDHIPNRFRDIFQKWMSPAALDLAERLLTYDPSRRITALQAMEAPYFTQDHPAASLPTGLATLEGEWHELESKRERAKKRRKNESGQ